MKRAREESMILEASRKVYQSSLVLYSKDLRGDFGAEMADVFDEQLAEAYSRSGAAGVLHVWFRAAREMVTVAIPGRLAGLAIPIVAVTATLAFMLWFAGYINYVMQTACSGCGH